MRISWRIVLAAALVVVACSEVSASQAVLDTLITKALDNYADLQVARFNAEASASSAKSAGTLPDPMLTIGLMNLPRDSWSFEETPMTGAAIGLSQQIPWPGKLSSRKRVAGLRSRQEVATVAAVENQVAREVADAYFEYSYWLEAEKVLNEHSSLLEPTQAVAEQQYAIGDASAQEVLRISSMESRNTVHLLKAVQQQESALLRLQRTVGDSSAIAALPIYLPEPPDSSPDETSIVNNPLVARARLGIERSMAKEDLARSDYRPNLTVGIDYVARRNIPIDPVRGTDFLSFKFGINLPLWFFAKQKNDVASARQQVEASRQQQRAVVETIETRLHDALLNLILILQSLSEYDSRILPQTEASSEAADVAYEVGKIDFDALLATQRDLLDVRLERLDLLRRFNQTQAMVAELQGTALISR